MSAEIGGETEFGISGSKMTLANEEEENLLWSKLPYVPSFSAASTVSSTTF